MTGYPEVTDVSLKLVSIINSYGIPCSLLTKGMLPSELADRKRFPQRNMHGISIVSVNEDFRRKWEPGTAPYRERIAALRYLYDCGLETRAHIEPYPTPNIIRQNLIGILEAVEFVDHIFFSGWNYNNFVKEYPGYREFYLENTEIVKEFCIERGIEFSH
jgi:DNA repair photolyase